MGHGLADMLGCLLLISATGNKDGNAADGRARPKASAWVFFVIPASQRLTSYDGVCISAHTTPAFP